MEGVHDQKPDAAIVDFYLRGHRRDGLETIIELRREIPTLRAAILYSAQSAPAEVANTSEVDLYLEKVHGPGPLISALESLLAERQS